jgi:hypothetical protein
VDGHRGDPRPSTRRRLPDQPIGTRHDDPPRRIVFTWGWETETFSTPPQSTLVEVSLTPEGEDTVVRLAHRRLRPEAVAFHRCGWEHYLPRLALIASGKDAGLDSWRDLEIATRALRAAGALPPLA